MRILITGATGFVGSHLVDVLAARSAEGGEDLRLRALVRSTSDTRHLNGAGVEPVVGDLGNPRALREAVADVDVIVHLAALTRARNEGEFRRANADGTRLLLEAALDAKRPRRMVYVSSLAAAGPAQDGRPVDAGDSPAPLTPYGRSKLEGEIACQEAGPGLDTVILRPPAVYGPRDRDLLIFFRMASWGILPTPTGPTRRLQVIHVKDLARAITVAGLSEVGSGVYHVAEARSYAWREILDLVAAAVDRSARHIPVPQKLLEMAGQVSTAFGQITNSTPFVDHEKVRELLAPAWLCETEAMRRDFAFETRIPLEEGLKDTARWYREAGWLR